MHRRVGIFSGTFDPIHQGHITFCLEAIRACKLDEVMLLPERLPRGKHIVTDFSHRVALLESAVEPLPKLRVAVLASDQFSVKHTLPQLQQMTDGAELTLLLGSDVVRTFLYRWEGLSTLLKNVSLAIGIRQMDTAADMVGVIHQLEEKYGLPIAYTLIESQLPSVTSSHIRNGEQTAALAPAAAAYIKKHKLYNL